MSFDDIRDTLESAASVAGNYFLPGSSIISDNLVSKGAQKQLSSPLGQIAQVASGFTGEGGFGDDFASAGGQAEQGLVSGAGNSIKGALGFDTTGPGLGDVLGSDASSLGNAFSNGVQDLGQFTDTSGLSSLFGGTAAPTSGLDAAYGGIQNAAADPAIASSAITPGASLTNVLPGSGSVGAAGGGAAGGGFDLGGLGDSLPSSTSGSLLSNLDTTAGDSFTQNPGSLLNGQANPLAPLNDFSTAGIGPSSIDTTPIGGFDSAAASNATVNPSNGFLSNLFGGGNAATPAGLSGDGSFGSGLSTTGTGALGSGVPTSAQGGSMGLAGLFGGGGNSTPGAGSNITNSLLKGGLGYLLNDPNTSGANAINSATQQAQAGFAPYAQAGANAENTLANLYGTNGSAAQTSAQQNFANTPGYQFALNQGLNAVNANAAAMGSPLSGNNEQAVNNYAQGTANQTYNNYVNQLQNLASGGLSATGGSGTAGLTGASALSQLDQNNANAKNTAIGTGLSGLFPSGGANLLSLLTGQGGGGNQNGLLSLFGLS